MYFFLVEVEALFDLYYFFFFNLGSYNLALIPGARKIKERERELCLHSDVGKSNKK